MSDKINGDCVETRGEFGENAGRLPVALKRASITIEDQKRIIKNLKKMLGQKELQIKELEDMIGMSDVSLDPHITKQDEELHEKLNAFSQLNTKLNEQLRDVTGKWQLAQKTIAQIQGTIDLVTR